MLVANGACQLPGPGVSCLAVGKLMASDLPDGVIAVAGGWSVWLLMVDYLHPWVLGVSGIVIV